MTTLRDRELERQRIQSTVDASKTALERNRLGQFATPPELARDLVHHAFTTISDKEDIHFLEPAIGTGSLFSALLNHSQPHKLSRIVGYEIDPFCGVAAAKLWQDTPLKLHLDDFTKVSPPTTEAERFNLVISNPPYVRHHHLASAEKKRLQNLSLEATGLKLSQLSGLYCHFLFLCHAWLRKGGTALWLVPGEFMDVNYGSIVKTYLTEQVTLVRMHRFASEDTQFADALVSSAVLVFKKCSPSSDHRIEVTFGGSLAEPEVRRHITLETLQALSKWSRAHQLTATPKSPDTSVKLRELFDVRRGLATGDNSFFILTSDAATYHALPKQFLRPILPSPRHLSTNKIIADTEGEPCIDNRRYLLDCTLPEEQVKVEYPTLWKYLERGRELDVHNRYLCKNRTPWYAQERRPAAPFLCSYMGRVNKNRAVPFRFILNQSLAVAANSFLLLYPKDSLQKALVEDYALYTRVWEVLSSLTTEMLVGEGRNYGGGLYKLEPKELANAPLNQLSMFI